MCAYAPKVVCCFAAPKLTFRCSKRCSKMTWTNHITTHLRTSDLHFSKHQLGKPSIRRKRGKRKENNVELKWNWQRWRTKIAEGTLSLTEPNNHRVQLWVLASKKSKLSPLHKSCTLPETLNIALILSRQTWQALRTLGTISLHSQRK